jgi:predicted transcriptional regulator
MSLPAAVRRHLGPLETEVMAVLWNEGESSVRTVTQQMGREIAYTTVMTTLTRLFHKGLVARRKQHSTRAFFYSARFTRPQLERMIAKEMIAEFLARPGNSRQELLSCLLDAVSEEQKVPLEKLVAEMQERSSGVSPNLASHPAEDGIDYSPS